MRLFKNRTFRFNPVDPKIAAQPDKIFNDAFFGKVFGNVQGESPFKIHRCEDTVPKVVPQLEIKILDIVGYLGRQIDFSRVGQADIAIGILKDVANEIDTEFQPFAAGEDVICFEKRDPFGYGANQIRGDSGTIQNGLVNTCYVGKTHFVIFINIRNAF